MSICRIILTFSSFRTRALKHIMGHREMVDCIEGKRQINISAKETENK